MAHTDGGTAVDQSAADPPAGPPTPVSTRPNPYERGPDPTLTSVAADFGPFTPAQLTVAPDHDFNGGYVYYPTGTSQTFGAVAIVPGYTALFAEEEAWMGPRLASFGFIVIGIETTSREDWDRARGAQLLAALDYLTHHSAVRTRVDAGRLAVIGHSMGGGGAFAAAARRPSLRAVVGLAPYFPSGNLANLRAPTMIIGGENDSVVTPSYLDDLYASLPVPTPSAYLMLEGADHLFPTRPNTDQMRLLIPWLKIFVDNDVRYTRFLCPLADPSRISRYRVTCPLAPTAQE